MMDVVNAKQELEQSSVEVPKPKVSFDFKAALQKAEQAKAAHVTQMATAESTVDIYNAMMNATTREEFILPLLSKMVAFDAILDDFGGVSDFKVSFAKEGRIINASTLASPGELRTMFDRWEVLTGQIPAYKLAIEREHQARSGDEIKLLLQIEKTLSELVAVTCELKQELENCSRSMLDIRNLKSQCSFLEEYRHYRETKGISNSEESEI